uniref:Uncharacterized protein n=1 Tax=Neobodo designis TaxID=312471 RepID=A0A7S1LDB0_NEODS
MRRHRDEHIARLSAARDAELERLRTKEARHVASEASKWRDFAGARSVRQDCQHLGQLGMSADESAAHMRQYYLQGGPSLVLSPDGSRRARRENSPRQPTTPSFRGVRSYADYAARWRDAYDAHARESPSPGAPSPPAASASAHSASPATSRERPRAIAGSLRDVFAEAEAPPFGRAFH